MLMTISSIGLATQVGANTIIYHIKVPPSEWKQMYKESKSDKAKEVDINFAPFAVAQQKADAGALYQVNAQQVGFTVYEHKNFGLAVSITQNAIDDNLYENDIFKMSAAAKSSIQVCEDIQGAIMFNNGHDAANLMYDGYPLFAPQRATLNGGITGNTAANLIGLNEAGLETSIIGIYNFLNDAGQPMTLRSRKLITSSQGNMMNAERLLNSRSRTETSNNEISAIYERKDVPDGYFPYRYLVDPNQWFMLSDILEGNRYFLRKSLEVRQLTDPSSFITTLGYVIRFSFGCSDWRNQYGSN